MFQNISLGKYFPGESLVHKIDARIKILFSAVFFVFLFLSKSYISLVLMLVFMILAAFASQISLIKYFKSLKAIAILSVVVSLLNLFFDLEVKMCGSKLFNINFKYFESSIFMFLRMISLMFMSCIIMFTTSAQEISNALESILFPFKYLGLNVQEIAITISISLRFMPIMLEEAEKIMLAQKAKGVDFETKNIIKKIKLLSGIIMPLFISSVKKGNDLALAMESRCYDCCRVRSKFKKMKLNKRDFVTTIFILLFFTGVIFCNHLKLF